MPTYNFLDFVKSAFIPADKQEQLGTIRNEDILRELFLCFEKTIDDQAMKDEILLYDSNYLIVLNPDDYNKREPTLNFVVQSAVNRFYKKIAAVKNQYSEKFVHPSNSWFFQFASAEKFNEIEIKKGNLLVISRFYAPRANSVVTGTIRVTMKPKMTQSYESLDLNLDSLGGVTTVGKGCFRLKFDKNLGKIADLPESDAEGFATFKYTLNGKPMAGPMHDKEIVISRSRADGVYPPNTLIIESDFLAEQHARVRFDENTNQFQIAAYSQTRVNERDIPLSRGTDTHWEILENNSKIMLGLLQLIFVNNK